MWSFSMLFHIVGPVEDLPICEQLQSVLESENGRQLSLPVHLLNLWLSQKDRVGVVEIQLQNLECMSFDIRIRVL